jgi:hypothetical protein
MIATPPPWSGRARIARGEACANFARNAGTLKKYGVAIDWYREALAVDPRATDYRIEMVRNLVSLGALNVAQREASIAAAIEPSLCAGLGDGRWRRGGPFERQGLRGGLRQADRNHHRG